MSGWETYYPDERGLLKRRRFHSYADVLDWMGPYPYKHMPSLPADIHPHAQGHSGDTFLGSMLLWNDGVIEFKVPPVPGLPELHAGWLYTLSEMRIGPNRHPHPGNLRSMEREMRDHWLAHILQRGLEQHPPRWHTKDAPEDEQTFTADNYPFISYSYLHWGSVVYEGETLDWPCLDRDLYSFTVGFTHHMNLPAYRGARSAIRIGPARYDLPFDVGEFPEYLRTKLMSLQAAYDQAIGLESMTSLDEEHAAALLVRVLAREHLPAQVIPVTPEVDFDDIIDLHATEGYPTRRLHGWTEPELQLLLWETLPNHLITPESWLQERQINRYCTLPFLNVPSEQEVDAWNEQQQPDRERVHRNDDW